jgi:hypothetical protein
LGGGGCIQADIIVRYLEIVASLHDYAKLPLIYNRDVFDEAPGHNGIQVDGAMSGCDKITGVYRQVGAVVFQRTSGKNLNNILAATIE